MTDPKRTYCPPLVAKALPDGHPQKREPMRPRGAGSEVRALPLPAFRGGDCACAACRAFRANATAAGRGYFGITAENAPRVLAAIQRDDTDIWTRFRCSASDLHARIRALPLPNALGLVAILVAGACVLVVGLAYGWGAAWRLAW